MAKVIRPSCACFLTPYDAAQELFSPFGQISRIYIAYDRETGENRGFAFVNFVIRQVPHLFTQKLQSCCGLAVPGCCAMHIPGCFGSLAYRDLLIAITDYRKLAKHCVCSASCKSNEQTAKDCSSAGHPYILLIAVLKVCICVCGLGLQGTCTKSNSEAGWLGL